MIAHAEGPLNDSLMKSVDPKISQLRSFLFRSIHNKLPTRAKIRQWNRRYNIPPIHDYTCPFGCDIIESLDHCLSCGNNPTYIDETEEQPILHVLKEIDPTIPWHRIELWYHHPPRAIQGFTLPTPLNETLDFPKGAGDIGIIPAQILKHINKRHGKKKAKQLVLKLQTAIVRRAKNIWRTRCTKHHEPIKELRKRQKEAKRNKPTRNPRNNRRKRKRTPDETRTTPKGHKRRRKKKPDENEAKRTKQNEWNGNAE